MGETMTDLNYEVLDLEQGSEEWKQVRLKYVTASQTPSLLNVSPYQTLYELVQEKLSGEEAKVSEYIQQLFEKGHKAESASREWVETDVGFKLPPKVILSKRCKGLLASLDGFNEDQNIILEVKYVGSKSLQDIKKGKIKPHHECQIQAQLLASGAKSCIYFASAENGDSAMINIKPKEKYFNDLTEVVSLFFKDLSEINLHKQAFEKYRDEVLSKYKGNLQPLKVLPSGAKDPFRVKQR